MTTNLRLPVLLAGALAAVVAGALGILVLSRAQQAAADEATPAATPALPAPRQRSAADESPFPRSLVRALRQRPVVVVSWFSPADSGAVAEARAGAALAGAGFVAINLVKEPKAGPLAHELDLLENPAVLVFTRGPKLRARLPGHHDREVVAQAATNAR